MPGGNGFTAEQVAFIRQVAREMLPTIEEKRREDIRVHLETCRWGKTLSRAIIFLIALAVANGLLNLTSILTLFGVKP